MREKQTDYWAMWGCWDIQEGWRDDNRLWTSCVVWWIWMRKQNKTKQSNALMKEKIEAMRTNIEVTLPDEQVMPERAHGLLQASGEQLVVVQGSLWPGFDERSWRNTTSSPPQAMLAKRVITTTTAAKATVILLVCSLFCLFWNCPFHSIQFLDVC